MQILVFFFFFQAEDGIRDGRVTGVQTCALPILTGNRAMVIEVVSPEEITCRFADGRLEDRFTFEVEPLLSLRDPRGGGRFVPLGPLVWLFLSSFVNRWFQQGAAASVTDRLRLVRPSESSRSPLAV